MKKDRASHSTAELTPPEGFNEVSSVIDVTALERLRAIGKNGDQILRRTVEAFFSSAPKQLDHLEEGSANGDHELVHRAAHTLKSSSLLMGAHRMGTLCGELEQVAATGSLDGVRSKVEQLRNEYVQARLALARESGVRLPTSLDR